MKCSSLKKVVSTISMLLIFLSFSLMSFAQETVKGKVLDKKDGTPIEGVTVQVKGTKTSTVTGADGAFTLRAPQSATLIFTFVGYASQEVKAGRGALSVSMEEAVKSMDDVVIIGYQSVQRRTTSAAVSTVKGKDFENMPYPTFDQMLQGRVAGLNVLNISGEPGANNIVNIRGSSAVLDPNQISAPLYVIDGVVFDVSDQRVAFASSNPLAAINPNDI